MHSAEVNHHERMEMEGLDIIHECTLCMTLMQISMVCDDQGCKTAVTNPTRCCKCG